MKNKYKIASVLFFCFSLLMAIIMVIYSLIEYQNYLKHPEYSAPFSAKLILIGTTYGMPIVIAFVISIIFKKKAVKH